MAVASTVYYIYIYFIFVKDYLNTIGTFIENVPKSYVSHSAVLIAPEQ